MVCLLSCRILMTVLLAPTVEQLDRHVTEWRVSLLDKGVTVNAGKSIVLIINMSYTSHI